MQLVQSCFVLIVTREHGVAHPMRLNDTYPIYAARYLEKSYHAQQALLGGLAFCARVPQNLREHRRQLLPIPAKYLFCKLEKSKTGD